MEAKDFLEKNGFVKVVPETWANKKCFVKVLDISSYSIRILGDTFWNDKYLYSQDLNIYWLIGVLTYYGLIDKNYKQ